MIIDSHVHYGSNSPWGDFSAEYLMDIIDGEVDFAICSNLEGIDSRVLKNELDCNLDMLETARKYPKLKPLVVCQPNIAEEESVIRSLLERYPEIVGLKFHPECMKLPADSDKYDKYLKLAQEFKKPCLYHSGHIKSRFSSPELIYKKARQFPDVPVILGHLSTGPKDSHKAAIEIMLDSIENNRANLYADVSWIDFAYETLNESMEDTIMLIKSLRNTKLGDFSYKILWASDAPVGSFNHARESYAKNLRVFKHRVLEEFNDTELLNNLLFGNACRLYALNFPSL